MNYTDLYDDVQNPGFYGEEDDVVDYDFEVPSPPLHDINEPVVYDHPVVTQQPPEQWFQRGHDQAFTIETQQPFSDYSLDLLFTPHSGGIDYESVSLTRKMGNGLRHNKTNDIRLHDRHLSVRPKIDICTRKGERLMVLQLTLSSGQVVKSRPFGVKNRQPKPNTFKSDAKRVLRQVEWCPATRSCHFCNQLYENGHLITCALQMLL
jgi:hypothetical protein